MGQRVRRVARVSRLGRNDARARLLRRRRCLGARRQHEPRGARHTRRARRAPPAGVVGRDGGYTATVADVCVVVPTVKPARVTPHTEAFQAVVWHLLVSHPTLQARGTTWETLDQTAPAQGDAAS